MPNCGLCSKILTLFNIPRGNKCRHCHQWLLLISYSSWTKNSVSVVIKYSMLVFYQSGMPSVLWLGIREVIWPVKILFLHRCIQILESHGIRHLLGTATKWPATIRRRLSVLIRIRPRSWKVVGVMENKPNGCHIFDLCTLYMFSAFTYIVHSQTQFNLLFSIITNCYVFSVIWKSDLFDIYWIKQSWKDMENGDKWSWKVLESAYKKVLNSHRKPLSVFSMHRVYNP